MSYLVRLLLDPPRAPRAWVAEVFAVRNGEVGFVRGDGGAEERYDAATDELVDDLDQVRPAASELLGLHFLGRLSALVTDGRIERNGDGWVAVDRLAVEELAELDEIAALSFDPSRLELDRRTARDFPELVTKWEWKTATG